MTGLPLPSGARLRVGLCERSSRLELCGLGRLSNGPTALEWTVDALRIGDDAGANVAVRQAPFVAGVHVVGKPALDHVPGLFADSLPDSWGRLLVDRRLRQLGIVPERVRGFDRLAIVGARGPGALVYEPAVPLSAASEEPLDLDQLARDAEVVLTGDEPDLLEALERAGGSAGGSRPKAWIAESADGRLRAGAHRLHADEIGWLVKFRAAQHDPVDIGPLELAYATMAREAGLDVAEPRLFETPRGRYFASRRFDREGPHRLHVSTVAGMLDVAAEQAVTADYTDLLKLTRHVTRSEGEVREAYRHAAFNVLSHNRDDHLKQFAFRRVDGEWMRAPAYDLTYSPGPGGEHTLLVAGEGRRPGRAHLLELAKRVALDAAVAARVLDEVRAAVARWREFASRADVGATSTAQVAEAMGTLTW